MPYIGITAMGDGSVKVSIGKKKDGSVCLSRREVLQLEQKLQKVRKASESGDAWFEGILPVDDVQDGGSAADGG